MNDGGALWDVPGPRARRRNRLCGLLFVTALAAAGWWILAALADRNQLAAQKWRPFVADARVWTEFLLPGLGNTLTAAALAMLAALPLGVSLATARLSRRGWIAGPAGTLVDVLRAIPVLMLMLLCNQTYALFTPLPPERRPLLAVVSALTLFNAAVLTEIIRAGILALPRGQSDAAYSLGLRKHQVMTQILLPQAVTAMLPALVAQLVVLVKDTALGGEMLGFGELLQQTRVITANYGANTIATLTVVAVLFIAINLALTRGAGALERRVRQGRRTTGDKAGATTETGGPTLLPPHDPAPPLPPTGTAEGSPGRRPRRRGRSRAVGAGGDAPGGQVP
ncbi:amino acid ABC transporter permease [Actinomadura kijaniata]|uniref:amino acid ABC transporter permease n=1 Tax=Actinomadura kijaniata TaxID=46161 RepID=UPI003F1DE9EA